MSADQDGEITKVEFQKQLRKVQVSEHACCPMFISRKATIENVELLRQLCMASFRECMSTQCNEKNKHERPKQFKLDNPTDGSKMATTGMFEPKQFQLKVEDHFIGCGSRTALEDFTFNEFTEFFKQCCLQYGEIKCSEKFLQAKRQEAIRAELAIFRYEATSHETNAHCISYLTAPQKNSEMIKHLYPAALKKTCWNYCLGTASTGDDEALSPLPIDDQQRDVLFRNLFDDEKSLLWL